MILLDLQMLFDGGDKTTTFSKRDNRGGAIPLFSFSRLSYRLVF